VVSGQREVVQGKGAQILAGERAGAHDAGAGR
jgi:hypothetical protein